MVKGCGKKNKTDHKTFLKEMSGYMALTNFRQNKSETVSRQYETDPSLDENIDALLEVKFSLRPLKHEQW